MDETALVVLIPEAEPLVAPSRSRYDPAARAGVPAHVTVLYPFRSVVDEAVADVVGRLALAVPAFDVTLAAVARFPGAVVYLVPEPAEPFRLLINGTVTTFADCPPYGGTIPNPIPHLTVADGVDTTTADAVEEQVHRGLPITARVERLTLLVKGSTGRWTVARHWPLG